MFSINVKRVRGKMAEAGYTISSMADRCGVNRNTFTNYLRNPDKIPFGIVAKMASLLCESHAEAQRIFFTEKLSQTKECNE